MGAVVTLPHGGWEPRPKQLPLWRYLMAGGLRAVAIWHRRFGKDDVCLHFTCIAAMERPAVYWHMLPKQVQARRAIWTAVNPKTGRKRIDEAFPKELRKRTLEHEMAIEFINGSFWQVIGSDNYDALVGAPPAGIVFSEWALSDPRSWAFLKPILDENGGWAVFITTPRGRNHAVTTYQNYKADPDAFAEILPASETGAFTPEALTKIEADYVKDFGPEIGEAMFRQEYLCDLDAPVIGSYYARLLNKADVEGRLVESPAGIHVEGWPVETWWDLGISDATAVWFVQVRGSEFRVVDFLMSQDADLGAYAKEILAKPYRYKRHVLPHDGDARELGTGLTRVETLRTHLPGHSVEFVPVYAVDDGINAVRQILPRCFFDAIKCKEGLDAMRSYHREWDDERKTFKLKPEHDWSSHPADAFRTGAMAWRSVMAVVPAPAKKVDRWRKPKKEGSSWVVG